MEWKTCTVCGHEFGRTEERQLITCQHGWMLCPCGVYGYACLHHEREVPEVDGRRDPIVMTVTPLPGDWELEAVSAGLKLLKAVMRQPQPAGLMDSDEEFGL
jgi:hypothetical protein